MLISPHFTCNYAPASFFLSGSPLRTLRACLLLLMKHFPSCSVFIIFKQSPQLLDLTLLFVKDYLIISILRGVVPPRWNKILLHISYGAFMERFSLLSMCHKFDSKPAGFLGECVPFLLYLCLNAPAACIYFISASCVTPAWRPSAKHSQIAVSQAYLWHDLWVGVTPDSQKDRHCPVAALSSCRWGALSALRQTRPPSLKRIKLFHHVGNEKAVITPN